MPKSLYAISFILCLLCLTTPAQQRVNDLAGFRLKQYREASHTELGEPDISDKAESGIEHEVFFLGEDPLLYVVFQYQPHLRGVIWSIQMSGNDPNADPLFFGLKFGMSEAEVEKRLGKATQRADAGEHGTRLHYGNANYSIEINKSGKLSSIRIFDDEESKTDPKFDKVPQAENIIKILTNGTNAQIAEVLSPDMETYVDGKIGYFGRSITNEVASDSSKIFSTIRDLSKELSRVDLKKVEEYEANARLRLGSDPLHVLKFKKTKHVREIVFKWDGFDWLLWEFDAGRPIREQETISGYPKRTFEEMVTKKADELEADPDLVVTGTDKKPLLVLSYDPMNSEITATYSGNQRKTPEERMNLIKTFFQTTGIDKEIANSFGTEIGLVENGKEYWVAANKDDLGKFTEKIKKGESGRVFISWLGFAIVSEKRENVFLLHNVAAVKD